MSSPERVIDNLHNQPPSDEQILQEQLAKSYAKDVEDYQNAVREESFLPPDITSDEDNGKYSDYDKVLSRLKAALESFRKKEKSPHAAKVAVIDSFFKSKTDNIKSIEERLDEKMKKYLKKKEDERRRIAEEKAAEERAEAARKLKAAEEAQKAAEEAARLQREEAARIQREADAARLKAEQDAAAARKKAEDEAAAIRKAAADEIARLEAEGEASKKALADAERAAKQAEREAKAVLESAEKEIKAENKALKEELRANDALLSEINKDAKTAEREANHALDDASRADKTALKAERVAEGKSSDFSRTRGTASLASTSDHWTGHLTDLDSLDLEALRYHIPLDALDKAIKSCVRAGNKQIKGASVYQETRLNNR